MGNKEKEERNLLLEGILNLEMLLMPYERFTYNDLLRELEVDYFAGYEELLPVMLMTTEDPVMERTGRRLFLELSGTDGAGGGTERSGRNDISSAGGAEKLAKADAVCAEGAGKGKIVGLERTG